MAMFLTMVAEDLPHPAVVLTSLFVAASAVGGMLGRKTMSRSSGDRMVERPPKMSIGRPSIGIVPLCGTAQ